MPAMTIAELLIDIGLDSKDAERSAAKIERELRKVKKAGEAAGAGTDKAEKSLQRLSKAAATAGAVANTLALGLTAVGGAVAGIGKTVLTTGAEFEKLRAQLKTATGSAEGAEKALGFIREFAKNTPFQVQEITEAFVKLTNLGLNPSERALTSFGDTASAMGKSLDQFIEAVADATTGEFERLKEFGIKSSSEGDRVRFTFRGITTEVGKNSREIEEFLIGLGENNFAGAMAEQMGTLNGIISNLKDAFAEFLLAVAEMGPLEEFKGLVADLRDASGDKEGLARTLARTLVTAIRTLRRALRGDLIGVLKTVAETIAFVVENFDKFIALIGAAKTLQAFSTAAQGLRSLGLAAGASLGPIGAIAAALVALIPIAVDAGNAIGDVLAKDRTVARAKDRGGNAARVTQEQGLGFAGAKATEALLKQEAFVRQLQAEGVGGFRLSEARRQQFRLQRELESVQKRAAEKAKAQAARDAQEKARQDELRAADEAEVQEFGAFDRTLEQIRKDIGIGEGEEGSTRQRSRLERATLALAENPNDLAAARKAAGLDRPKGRGRRKPKEKKAAPKVTSPTTVSEFFGAAARGELGPIAARTPSTKDIEPTVAVDITNNNFKFDVKQNITGQTDPAAIGMEAAKAIRTEFETRLAAAGQQLASNIVR